MLYHICLQHYATFHGKKSPEIGDHFLLHASSHYFPLGWVLPFAALPTSALLHIYMLLCYAASVDVTYLGIPRTTLIAHSV